MGYIRYRYKKCSGYPDTDYAVTTNPHQVMYTCSMELLWRHSLHMKRKEVWEQALPQEVPIREVPEITLSRNRTLRIIITVMSLHTILVKSWD